MTENEIFNKELEKRLLVVYNNFKKEITKLYNEYDVRSYPLEEILRKKADSIVNGIGNDIVTAFFRDKK